MPVIIFVICLIFGTPVKKSFSSAVLVGVGLKGMAFITSAFGGILSPLVQQIVDTTGLNLPALGMIDMCIIIHFTRKSPPWTSAGRPSPAWHTPPTSA